MPAEGPISPELLQFPQSVLDSAPVGMMIIGGDGTVSWANRAAAQMLRTETQSMLGQPVSSLITPSHVGPVLAAFAGLLEGRAAVWESEDRWLTAGGQTVWLRLSASPVPGPALPRGGRSSPAGRSVICQFLDVTARKEAEAALAETRRELERRNRELERSNQELTEFAYVASHDLSEPLRVIAGHVELLAQRYRGALDENADRWIEFAVDGCNRMRTLIGDLLRYSRTGRELIEPGPVDMDEITRQAEADLGPMIADAGARVSIDALPTVLGDAGQLRQLMANLLSNAVKFSRPGTPPEVDVTAGADGGYWEFRVSDQGIGIAEEYRQRIFGIFQRLHGRDSYAGSGIGLAIARKIVELHGGTIWADSGPGGGCEIHFTIPAERV